jgi:hypothetical protein
MNYLLVLADSKSKGRLSFTLFLLGRFLTLDTIAALSK